ncbi:MAG: porin [Methylobacter sp.]|uniref:Porin n=1 Tax=Candidatus Methylobacter titanis TaxID=3053457 RepID=A0AA43TIN8_9GAMM|nr:porin [Candidatus Methylobacter titanis]MDI1293501.1 porin [Candidatus Methylobacter titanis]
MTTVAQLKISVALFCVLNSLTVIADTIPHSQAVELYFDPETKQIGTEPGKDKVKLSALQSIEGLEQKKQELAVIENRLDAKMKALDEKLKRLENMESIQLVALAPPEKTVPVSVEKIPVQTGETKKSDETKSKAPEKFPATVSYGDKGFELKTKDGKFAMQIQNRLQFRYANPFDSDPRSLADMDRDQSSFMVRRARFKVGGHAYWPWLKYYMQYDWSQPVLRDFYLDVSKYSWAQLRLGRGKVLWNDERVTSSGKQQFANRSIINDIFTVDRQQGAQVFGRVFPGKWYDFSYAAGVFSGLGVGERNNDDDNMMYSGRLQWNLLGEELAFSQSDTEFHEKPAASLAFAAATNTSKCTSFETDSNSCRALPGFVVGKAGQFRVNQMMEEFRFKWQGFSLQNEFHWKQVEDTLKTEADPARNTDLLGAYVQAGYFPHALVQAVPKQLEFAVRYAFVDPNADRSNDLQQEVSAAINWFFTGHANKLTFEISHLRVEDPVRLIAQSEERARMQWDVSF